MSVVLVLPMGGIYEVHHRNGPRWHDIHPKFHDDPFRHSSNITITAATIFEAVMLVLVLGEIYELRRWDGLRWLHIYTKFHEVWYRRSSNIKVISQNVRGCNVGITDGRDL
jgi:hypothetical protein